MRQHRAKNHLPQMQGKLYCWRARDSAFQDSPKKQAPSPIEDAEEELEESPKPKKKKKKQSGSGSGLAIGLSVGGLILLGALGYGVYFLISNGFLGSILGSKHESVIKSLISNLEEMASVLESVKDESSAQAAAPRIVTISGKLSEQQKAMKEMKVAKVEDERLKKKYEEKLRAATVRLGTAGFQAGVKGGRDPTFRDAIRKMQQLRY